MGQRVLAIILIMVILILVVVLLNVVSQLLTTRIGPTITKTWTPTRTSIPYTSPPSQTTQMTTTYTQTTTLVTKFIRETMYEALLQFSESVEPGEYAIVNTSIKVNKYLVKALEIRVYKSSTPSNKSSITIHRGAVNQIYKNVSEIKPPRRNCSVSWRFHIPEDIDQPYLVIYIYPILTDEKGALEFFTIPIVIDMKVRGVTLVTTHTTFTITTGISSSIPPLAILQQCLRFETDKHNYSVGESVSIRLINICNITIKLRPRKPWSIYIYDPVNKHLKDLVFQPSTNILLELELKPGENASWIWDTVTLYYTTKPGNYAVALAPKIILEVNDVKTVISGTAEFPRAEFLIVAEEIEKG